MRSRNIKPGFFKNEELAECEPLARLLFSGLWCMADREGRLEYRPKRIKAEVLPYDNCNIEKLLKQLSDKKFILIFYVNNENYIEILNFRKHQNCHIKEAESTIPAPDKHCACPVQESVEHGTSPADSLLLIPDSPLPLTDTPSLNPSCAQAHVNKANMFARFWEKYPKKKSKGAAEKAFLKINPDEHLLNMMLSAIERAKTSEDWTKEKGKYIPHPATWLNAKGWLDEETESHPLAGVVSDTTLRNITVLEGWRPPA